MPLFLRFVKKSMMFMLPENGSGPERIMKKKKDERSTSGDKWVE